MRYALRPLLENLLAPLCLAAYVAWVVVWLGSARTFEAFDAPGELVARLALIAFLLGFVVCVSDVLAGRAWAHRAVHLAMAVIALGLVAAHRSGVTPILLVLLIAVVASHASDRELVVWFFGINLAVVAILALRWRLAGDGLWITTVAHVSFQAFAALLMRGARRAEEMSERLRATNAELLTTRTLLAESARDQERLRLSRELHDVAGHGLTALKLNLESLARDPRQPDLPRLELCAGLADELLQNLRRVVGQMRADPGIDLRAALERLGAPIPRPRLVLDLDAAALVGRAEVEAVLRAVQEALTNAARHGPARELHVELRPVGEGWRLRIEDDGRLAGDLVPGGGLAGMRERFEELGGRLEATRGARGGVKLEACWPRRAAAA